MEGHTLMATDDPVFTPQEAQVLEMLVADTARKRIAHALGVTPGRVSHIIRAASNKVPGSGTPSYKLTRWFWSIAEGSTGEIRTTDG